MEQKERLTGEERQQIIDAIRKVVTGQVGQSNTNTHTQNDEDLQNSEIRMCYGEAEKLKEEVQENSTSESDGGVDVVSDETQKDTDTNNIDNAPTTDDGKASSTEDSNQTISPAGMGSDAHKNIQAQITNLAQQKNLGAFIEYTTDDGGRVDVAIIGGSKRIACEVAIHNSAQYECGNIEKCLADGFDEVLVIALDQNHQNAIESLAKEDLTESAFKKIQFMHPDAMEAYFDNLAAHLQATVIRGYNVHVDYEELTEDQRSHKYTLIEQAIERFEAAQERQD